MIYVKGADGKAKVVTSHLTDGELYYDKGKQDEYDRFWEAIQDGGKRTVYNYTFSRWGEIEINPKYLIQPTSTGANNMFNLSKITTIDWSKLDFSKCKQANGVFTQTKIRHIPLLDFQNVTLIDNLFTYANIETIDKIKLNAEGKTTFYSVNSFDNCPYLKNITFEGIIPSSLRFSSSPLTKASITSIINALSSTVTGKTLTLSKTAVNKAFETSEGANDGSSSQEWLNLVATKSNWTISLA